MADKKPAKPKAKAKKSLYDIKDGKISRNHKHCPKCGDGTYLAEHKNRVSCGKCSYTEFRK